MRKGYDVAEAGRRKTQARPYGSPDDEGSLAREIAGEPEERAYLLSLGFDPAVVEKMLAADRAGAPLNRTPPKGTAAEMRRKLNGSYHA